MASLSTTDLRDLGRRFFAREVSFNEVAAEHSLAELCEMLLEVKRQVTERVRGLGPAQLAYRLPGKPGGWDASGDEEHFDISQIVTHVAISVAFFRWNVTRALGHPRPPFPRPPHGATTTGRAGSPMGRGGWTGVGAADLVELLDRTTGDFVRYLRDLPRETDLTEVAPYGEWGDLSVRGWVLMASAHMSSHVAQLDEIRSSRDFPTS